MTRLDCISCGARIEVPPGFGKAKLRCEACGYYVPVPAALRSQIAEVPEPVAASASSIKTKKPKSEAAPLIRGSENEDDGLPYTVPGDPVQKCNACHKDLPLDAAFCVHCGIDFATKKKKKKKHEEVNKSWEPRWPLELRLQVFGGLQVVNLMLAVFVLESFGLIQVVIQAFILGTFEKLTVTRTPKGACTIVKTWRFAFYAHTPKTIDHRESQGVGVIATQNAGIVEWFTMIYLTLLLIIPGVLFYWFIMRPDRFNVSLCDVYGSTNEIAFRTTDRAQAEEICETIRDCAGLWYKPVM